MEIKKIKTKEECALCDEFLSKLNAYESCFDDILNSEFKFKEIHEKSLKNDFVYIAVAYENVPIGYVFSYLKTSKGKVHKTNLIEIEALFVEETFRKKGVGKKLIESVEKWAKENFEDYVIELHAINDNVGAVSFYESLGFNAVRTIFRK